MSTLKELYSKKIKNAIQEKYKYESAMLIPKLSKIIVHRGLGEAVSNSKVIEHTVEQIKAITGRKPILTRAKKSISNFKLREGQVIGCKVTLRSEIMYDFLTKLINVILPKIRDFRGISNKGFDGRGNYTLGFKEDIVFPEINYDKIDKIRGMDINIVTTAKTDEEAYEMLKLFGMPFQEKAVN